MAKIKGWEGKGWLLGDRMFVEERGDPPVPVPVPLPLPACLFSFSLRYRGKARAKRKTRDEVFTWMGIHREKSACGYAQRYERPCPLFLFCLVWRKQNWDCWRVVVVARSPSSQRQGRAWESFHTACLLTSSFLAGFSSSFLPVCSMPASCLARWSCPLLHHTVTAQMVYIMSPKKTLAFSFSPALFPLLLSGGVGHMEAVGVPPSRSTQSWSGIIIINNYDLLWRRR